MDERFCMSNTVALSERIHSQSSSLFRFPTDFIIEASIRKLIPIVVCGKFCLFCVFDMLSNGSHPRRAV